MTTLKRSGQTSSHLLRCETSPAETIDRRYVEDPDPAAYSRFKAQLKRAVDSVDAPEYLIDAIKTAIRR